METLWAFLSDPDNQQTLAWLGGGLVVVAGGLWAVIKFFFPRSSGSTPTSQTISADHGGIAAGGNVSIDRRKGLSGIEVSLLVAVVIGGLLLAVAWLVPQNTEAIRADTQAIREDTDTLITGQNQLVELNRRQIELLEQEKGVSRTALINHLVRLGADPAIDQSEIPAFLGRFADEFVELRAQWAQGSVSDPDLAAAREAALVRLDAGDLDGARSVYRDAIERRQELRRERNREDAQLLADAAGVERLDLRYRDAAALYQEAADLLPADDAWDRWANLVWAGLALSDQGREFGDNAALAEAIATYETALGLAPRDTRPDDWAMTQNNLGLALGTLGARESGTAPLERAVQAYEAALLDYTRERVPLDWATTQNNLGTALQTLGARESGTATLERAVQAYEAALEEYTRERVPLDWAMTQNNLGKALGTLGERESGTATLERAVQAYEAALLERTRERVPLDWAYSRHNLALALEALAEREGDDEWLRQAIVAMEDAAAVYAEGGVSYWLPVAEESVARMRGNLATMTAKE